MKEERKKIAIAMAAVIERIKERHSKEVSELRSIVDYLHQQWQRDYIMYQLKQDELISDLLQLQQELIRERMQSAG